jgi:hypothetical protein
MENICFKYYYKKSYIRVYIVILKEGNKIKDYFEKSSFKK